MTNDEYNAFIIEKMSALEKEISSCLNRSLSLPERLAIHDFVFSKYPWLKYYRPDPTITLSLIGKA